MRSEIERRRSRWAIRSSDFRISPGSRTEVGTALTLSFIVVISIQRLTSLGADEATRTHGFSSPRRKVLTLGPPIPCSSAWQPRSTGLSILGLIGNKVLICLPSIRQKECFVTQHVPSRPLLALPGAARITRSVNRYPPSLSLRSFSLEPFWHPGEPLGPGLPIRGNRPSGVLEP